MDAVNNRAAVAGTNSETPPDNGMVSIVSQEAFRAELNHKLRTPLNAIIGFAELLALQPESKRGAGDIQQILKSARELQRIIERDLADPSEGASSKTGASRPASRACDILYIEDDEVNFILVERILEYRPGVKVMHAERAGLGLEMAESCQPKLILLDLNLPDMHGSEVLQRLRQNPPTEHIPVVILSADATPSQIERLLTAGARNYLTKPFDLDPFLAVVDEFVAEPAVGLSVVG